MDIDLHTERTRSIIGAFFTVYNRLDYGFLEVHYGSALERELTRLGHVVVREFAARVFYEGEEIGFHRLDMVVDSVVVVELKATPLLPQIARRQLYNYLRATNLEVGLLLHFGPTPRFQKIFVPRRRDFDPK
jgi:GxxExxY protein